MGYDTPMFHLISEELFEVQDERALGFYPFKICSFSLSKKNVQMFYNLHALAHLISLNNQPECAASQS